MSTYLPRAILVLAILFPQLFAQFRILLGLGSLAQLARDDVVVFTVRNVRWRRGVARMTAGLAGASGRCHLIVALGDFTTGFCLLPGFVLLLRFTTPSVSGYGGGVAGFSFGLFALIFAGATRCTIATLRPVAAFARRRNVTFPQVPFARATASHRNRTASLQARRPATRFFPHPSARD